MRKLLIPICLVIVLALLALIQLTQTYNLNINSSYSNVFQNLTTAKGWAKWYSPFNNKDAGIAINSTGGFKIQYASSVVALKQKGLGAFDVEVTDGYNVTQYACFVTASDTLGITKLYVSRKANMLKYIWWLIKDTKSKTFVYDLKSYLEDARKYYGFVINKQLAKEQLMMVKRQKINNNNICQSNRAALRSLLDFSSINKLKITGPVQLQYLTSMNDSTEIMVGFPVAKKQGEGAGIQYMDTHSGKILVGYFKGKYKDREKLYAAMSLYLADHYLHEQTKPFEKFKDNQLPTDNDGTVELELIIPYV
ncbi:MAG: hypothetical protein V4520_19460 [Bacteroidota bacterium]